MPKLTEKERELAKKHPVSFPIFVILAIMIVSILILGYFLYQTVAENTRLKQKYQNNTQNIDSSENMQDQQLEDNLDNL